MTCGNEAQIRVGVDVVGLDRFRRVLTRSPGLVDRLFTADERLYANAARDSTERFASRFAAKEATMKALGVGLGSIGWHEVEVQRLASGEPILSLTGQADRLARERRLTRWAVSLAHDGGVAIAVVTAIGPT